MTVGERIETKRKEKGLSMEALGELLGVGRSAINKWEKGYVQRISRPMIIKMANIFECDPAWLGGYKDEEQSPNLSSDELERTILIRDLYAKLPPEVMESDTLDEAMDILSRYENLPQEKKIAFQNYLKFLQSDS